MVKIEEPPKSTTEKVLDDIDNEYDFDNMDDDLKEEIVEDITESLILRAGNVVRRTITLFDDVKNEDVERGVYIKLLTQKQWNKIDIMESKKRKKGQETDFMLSVVKKVWVKNQSGEKFNANVYEEALPGIIKEVYKQAKKAHNIYDEEEQMQFAEAAVKNS